MKLYTLDQFAAASGLNPLDITHILDLGDIRPHFIEPDHVTKLGSLVEKTLRFSDADIPAFQAEVARREQVFDDFRRDYADIYKPDVGLDARGLETKAGWMPLLREHCDRLRDLKLDVRLRWCKEKFGSLRTFHSEDRMLSRLQSYWLDVEYERTRRKSLTICQECGQSGRLRIGLHYATLCDRHAHLVGHLRSEDGLILDPDRQSIVDGRVVWSGPHSGLKGLPDAAFGLDDGKTWDSRKAFMARFQPMLQPVVELPQTDRELAILEDRLMQVDATISDIRDVDFSLHVFRKGQKPEYSLTIPDDYDEQAIREEVEKIMTGDGYDCPE
jgi:hypothetical protein